MREGAGPEPADDHRPALTSETASTPAGRGGGRPLSRPGHNKNGGARAAAEYSSMTQGSDSKPLIERRSIDYIPANERHGR
ncbi:hypothetical protein, partial [Pseudomonas plecoglossicida]|uniref:hypothetical protein n=1 Tax=Pseudomonas plecoglossicida TaxID=70775 RepID=UPI0011AEC902